MVPLSFLTPTQNWKEKKVPDFFSAQYEKHLESLPVENPRCLGMRMISKAHGKSGGSRRLEDATTSR